MSQDISRIILIEHVMLVLQDVLHAKILIKMVVILVWKITICITLNVIIKHVLPQNMEILVI